MTKLSTSQKIAIVVPIVVAFIGGAWYFLVKEYYSPDLRYEEAPYYRSGDEAVASLRLHNFGETDAKDVRITVEFPKPLVKDVSTDDDAYPFMTKKGGKGEETVFGTIDRVSPGQTTWVYFSIQNPKGLTVPLAKDYVRNITYEGGKGKTGQPVFFRYLSSGFVYFVMTLFIIVVAYIIPAQRVKRLYAEALQKLNQIAQERTNEIRRDGEAAIQKVTVAHEELSQQVRAAHEEALELQKVAKESVEESKAGIEECGKKLTEIEQQAEQFKKERDEAKAELLALKAKMEEQEETKGRGAGRKKNI